MQMGDPGRAYLSSDPNATPSKAERLGLRVGEATTPQAKIARVRRTALRCMAKELLRHL